MRPFGSQTVFLSKGGISHQHQGIYNRTGTENAVKFLKFRTPKNFAVIYLKFKQRGQTLEYFVKKMQLK